MEWEVEWTDDSRKDLKELDGSLRKQVLQAIKKVKKKIKKKNILMQR